MGECVSYVCISGVACRVPLKSPAPVGVGGGGQLPVHPPTHPPTHLWGMPLHAITKAVAFVTFPDFRQALGPHLWNLVWQVVVPG